LTNWASVSAGIDHTLALKTDGTLWTWGSGYYRNLGFGSSNNTSYNSPVQLGSLTTWIKLPEKPGGSTISAAIST
jgi:alpha-tubulin suppressor-like RCC1 family protein